MKGFKDVVILVLIAVFAAVALSGVYLGTKEQIALAKQKELEEALKKVCPFLETDYRELTLTVEGKPIPVYAVTREGQLAGAALKMVTSEGFGGDITLLVGVNADHAVTGVYILEHKETPGLGTKAADKDWWGQMLGKTRDTFTFRVKKDKGDVDAITAATITSRAVTHAVGRALEAYSLVEEQMTVEPVDLTGEPEKEMNDTESPADREVTHG